MSIICPVCESKNFSNPKQLFSDAKTGKEYRLYLCSNCDIEFWTPLTMPPSDYYEDTIDGEYHKMHFENELSLRSYHKGFINKYKKIRDGGRILDIGCGDGRFLKKMKDLGWEISGIDMDKFSVENARRKCGSDNIYCCKLDEYIGTYFYGEQFDLITFFEVMEHQPNPNVFIHIIQKLLKDNGSIGGSVPDRNRYIVPIRFSPDNPPHHFTLWTQNNIFYFLKQNNFTACRLFHTRFEPIFINQIINYLYYIEKKAIWESSSSIGIKKETITFKRKVKRTINPLLNVIEYLEMPFLVIFRKSVCLLFIARLNE